MKISTPPEDEDVGRPQQTEDPLVIRVIHFRGVVQKTKKIIVIIEKMVLFKTQTSS